ncbi:hypothetical protein [Corynebacterium atrinae]|uniref:hypothetical protein n=1 Tax=Corynebacterium atrinae TaxID=1336740 RepID=UPI0025B55EFC|nr:hypothetical protein [Corynebacterium atrinae]
MPDPTHPIALIDVRDLAEWIVECAEQRHCGIFNAAGDDGQRGWGHGHYRCVAALHYEERRQEPRLAGLSDEEEKEIRRKLSGG